MKLLIKIADSKGTERFAIETTDESIGPSPRVLADRLRTWLARAVSVAISSRTCTSFIVSVHHFDSACDHEHGSD